MPEIQFKLPNHIKLLDNQKYVEKVASQILKEGRKRKINVPKKMTIGGWFGDSFHVCYRNNAFRDLIIEVGTLQFELEQIYYPGTKVYCLDRDGYFYYNTKQESQGVIIGTTRNGWYKVKMKSNGCELGFRYHSLLLKIDPNDEKNYEY